MQGGNATDHPRRIVHSTFGDRHRQHLSLLVASKVTRDRKPRSYIDGIAGLPIRGGERKREAERSILRLLDNRGIRRRRRPVDRPNASGRLAESIQVEEVWTVLLRRISSL